MRLVIQRVKEASVEIAGEMKAKIEHGLLLLVGIEHRDTPQDIEYLVQKVKGLRIFADTDGKMNCSIDQVGGQCLVVSQFTLHASTKKGNRPSFIQAAPPEQAIPLYELFIQRLALNLDRPIEKGVFGADMQVHLINDGPVTILMDSHNRE